MEAHLSRLRHGDELVRSLIDDPLLPHLSRAVDATWMAARFDTLFRENHGARFRVIECQVERVQYRRGKRCRFLYRLRFEGNGNGSYFTHWFCGKLVPQRQFRKQLGDAQRRYTSSVGPWKPVYRIDDLSMILWPFPLDSDMPGLRLAASPDAVKKELLRSGARESSTEQVILSIHQHKYMPGKRCVLRVHFDQTVNGNREPWFYSKTYSDGQSRLNYDMAVRAYRYLRDAFEVPEPLYYWAEAHTFWQRPWKGVPLLQALECRPMPELWSVLGERTARMHCLRIANLPVRFQPRGILAAAEEDARMLQWLLPDHAALFQSALHDLQAATQAPGNASQPVVPIHGALRIEQFLLRGEHLALVDFDALSAGDPLFDVAEFVVSLQMLHIARPGFQMDVDEAVARFLDSYRKTVPWEVPTGRLAWYACAFLLGKLHNSIKNLELPLLERFDQALALLETWMEQCR